MEEEKIIIDTTMRRRIMAMKPHELQAHVYNLYSTLYPNRELKKAQDLYTWGISSTENHKSHNKYNDHKN